MTGESQYRKAVKQLVSKCKPSEANALLVGVLFIGFGFGMGYAQKRLMAADLVEGAEATQELAAPGMTVLFVGTSLTVGSLLVWRLRN